MTKKKATKPKAAKTPRLNDGKTLALLEQVLQGGRDYPLAAMHLGHTSVQAVEVALTPLLLTLRGLSFNIA